MEIIKFIFFIVSLVGYTSFIRLMTSISKYHIYIVVISCQVVILYLSSLVNFLFPASLMIYFLGILLFIFSIVKAKGLTIGNLLNRLNFVTFGMLFYVGVYIAALWNQSLLHYDNFTHWATIVKFLFLEDRLPAVADRIISYNTYPVGSSLYLYYITKYVGFSEGIMLVGQFLIIAAAQFSIFGVVKDHRRLLPNAIIFASLGVMTYLNFSIRFNNLLVDLLIAILAISAISVLYLQKNNFLQISFFISIILSFLVLVKASALFFVICIIIAYLGVFIRKNRHEKNIKLYLSSLLLLLPIIFNQLWSVHVKSVFAGMASKKHDFAAGPITSVFEGRLSLNQQLILNNYLKTVFSIHTLTSLQIIVIFSSFLIFSLVIGIKFKTWKTNIMVFWANVLITFLYYFGNLIMYLTAMPVEEAKRIAGFERYILTIIVINFFMFIIQGVRQLDDLFYEKNYSKRDNRSFKNFKNKNIYENATLLAIVVFLGFVISDTNGIIKQNMLQSKDQIILKKLSKEKDYGKGKFLIVSDNKELVDNYFLSYYSRYQLWNSKVDVKFDFMTSEEKFEKTIKNYDGIFLLNNHYTFKANVYKMTNKKIKPGYYSLKWFQEKDD
ncbi:hypothetical protein [Streptococcus parauberis]|uniref:hypothetical protein n=1 Tax=Streptococcus parauberis TaxID=1348 RepID=UPI000789C03F|nr:hypothetical protein [Streptococcus parauberis]KYP17167.1 hypothetical protein TN39_02080 [Streptococcus parauberis]KYP17190.1 hypothetical protein AKL14_01614 [Streptococcus parauberis]KYP17401.1 hypothetical protein AKL13_02071 [Streptococcus parauberis]KYP23794.1 hypothetical protein TM50_01630 [Streptococcus parauberis]KYP23889.1 hypothetical protein TP84_01884 [Streptococcus parauberis]